jgi:SAM-dependent methyltransferase
VIHSDDVSLADRKLTEVARITALVRCPRCKGSLTHIAVQLRCSACNLQFPIVGGVPVLINEDNSVFAVADFVDRRETFFKQAPKWKRQISNALPSISLNARAHANYATFAQHLLNMARRPRLLVIGGSIEGIGSHDVLHNDAIDITETDVSWGPRTQIIADAHDLPFPDASFDGVIVQAVLEHVVDPYRCVAEIHRVLSINGLVYAETPFIQQVHGAAYDFHRFTHLGHRRLFRHFGEVRSGAVCGPGMALAWSYTYFLMSFARGSRSRSALRLLGRLSSFWLKYFDYALLDKPTALDAASAVYFLGRKSAHALPDRDLIRAYTGGMR